ncbi:hypothetical protein EV384_6348 [Micromonospora kangleipakensis]|uniref:Uncharacterized protein n=1 Tax=Micromonospora kangleipakensis TaxID=1077942 RepID=A0A4Q8BHU2_9ACTN|nr:hypothetical protein [Micromonospora kangleipakensis]RZU77617.1 hypothetical protein EV384_6348 [Micromonospora kangleipakensis]
MSTQTQTIPTLVTDLLWKVYGERVATIEVADPKGYITPPAVLPVVRVRPRGAERMDIINGQVDGDVQVVVYTDEAHPLTVDRMDFATGHDDRVVEKYASHGSGDLRFVKHGGTPKSSALHGGIVATMHTWTIAGAILQVPTIVGDPVPASRVSALVRALASNVSARASDYKVTQARNGDTVTRTVQVNLAVDRSVRIPAGQLASLTTVGVERYRGKAVDAVGRCTSAEVVSVDPEDRGVHLTARLVFTSQAPTA